MTPTDANKVRFKPLKGHKCTYDRSGSEDTYWTGRCECGWHSWHWTTRKGDIIHAHRRHVDNVRQGKRDFIRGRLWRDWAIHQTEITPTKRDVSLLRALDRGDTPQGSSRDVERLNKLLGDMCVNRAHPLHEPPYLFLQRHSLSSRNPKTVVSDWLARSVS